MQRRAVFSCCEVRVSGLSSCLHCALLQRAAACPACQDCKRCLYVLGFSCTISFAVHTCEITCHMQRQAVFSCCEVRVSGLSSCLHCALLQGAAACPACQDCK